MSPVSLDQPFIVSRFTLISVLPPRISRHLPTRPPKSCVTPHNVFGAYPCVQTPVAAITFVASFQITLLYTDFVFDGQNYLSTARSAAFGLYLRTSNIQA